jgi:hypothetical protein
MFRKNAARYRRKSGNFFLATTKPVIKTQTATIAAVSVSREELSKSNGLTAGVGVGIGRGIGLRFYTYSKRSAVLRQLKNSMTPN